MQKRKTVLLNGVRYLALLSVVVLGLMSIIATGGDGGGGAGGSASVGGAGTSGGTGGAGGGGTGVLSVGLMDSATDDYKAVYVTIKEVSVHMAGEDSSGWEIVASPETTYDLLELVNGVIEQLGVTDFATGHYTQMRLLLSDVPDAETNLSGVSHPFANYVIEMSGTTQELKVPSGLQSGIKLVHGFDITSGATTELVLDFDASKSIVKAGASGNLILKPTIKVIDVVESPGVNGVVTESGSGNTISGVYVSAQIYDSGVTDERDRVTVSTASLTDENGGYSFYLEPGTYYLVAYKDGYEPACSMLTAEMNGVYTEDFGLVSAVTGTITGTVTMLGAGVTDYQSADISFRQPTDCGSGTTLIEVKSVNVEDGGSYSEDLPTGAYTVVAWTDGALTLTQEGVNTGSSFDPVFAVP